jgi:hypothetical protein
LPREPSEQAILMMQRVQLEAAEPPGCGSCILGTDRHPMPKFKNSQRWASGCEGGGVRKATEEQSSFVKDWTALRDDLLGSCWIIGRRYWNHSTGHPARVHTTHKVPSRTTIAMFSQNLEGLNVSLSWTALISPSFILLHP